MCGSIAYVAVIVWAFVGIADTSVVSATARIAAVVVALTLLIGVPRRITVFDRQRGADQ